MAKLRLSTSGLNGRHRRVASTSSASTARRHRLAQQIPAPRQHLVRYYGAYSNRARREFRPSNDKMEVGGARGPKLDADALADPESEFATERRQSWARLLRKMPGAVLMQSLQSGSRSWALVLGRGTAAGSSSTTPVERNGLEAPVVVDSILRHVEQGGGHDPHAPRAPPAA